MNGYRALFLVAAAFHFFVAIVSGLFTEQFFELLGSPPPELFSWKLAAIVIGLFAVAYAYAAMRPDRADPIIGLALASKVIGPIGWLILIRRGDVSPILFPLVAAGDLIWLFPFLAFLLRRSKWRRTQLAWLGVAIHLLAGMLLLAVAAGTERETVLATRQTWIREHPTLWSTAWLVWAAASLSLACLCAVWTARLRELAASRAICFLGCGIVWLGVMFDLAGETTLIARASREGLTEGQFGALYRQYQWLSPALANGLYCVGGLILSAASWGVGLIRGWIALWGVAMWTVGLLLSAAAIIEHLGLMTITGAGVMLMFTPWSGWLGWRLRDAPVLKKRSETAGFRRAVPDS